MQMNHQTLLLFLMFGLMFGIDYSFRKYGFNMTFWISEFDKEVTVFFSARDVLELININLIYPIFAVWVRKCVNRNYYNHFKVPLNTEKDDTREKNHIENRKKDRSDYIYYVFFGTKGEVATHRSL